MTFWLPSSGRLYLPPPTPVAQILETDDFVTRTDVFYQTSTERLLMVGHPYYDIKDPEGKLLVPKVSGSQFRVFRLRLPDPNKFTFQTQNLYNPDKQRLVWAMRGIEISRGQPIGIGVTGHPFFNKLKDAENPTTYPTVAADDRQNVCVDSKQVQMFIVGCTPCEGEHWDAAKPCTPLKAGECPPLELVNSTIQDGDMCDTGFGILNFKNLQKTKSDSPLDIVAETVKYPDILKMCNEPYGNQMWFYAKREQMYIRHLWSRAGSIGDEVPPAGGADPGDYLYPSSARDKQMVPPVYFGTPSGSLVSSDQNIFNRPFWIHKAQGINNGIAWNNQIFVTAVDTTRGTNFTISVPTDEEAEHERLQQYTANKFKHYNRHVEEYEISMIMQLCVVDLSPETLAHLHSMSPSVLEGWNLGFIQPPNNLEDQYRLITSAATRCPTDKDTKVTEDQYAKYKFWDIDLSERFTQNLEQSNLGRKWLFQIGKRATKRSAPKTVTFESKASKRRRKNV
ncbi:L1 capsid protein [Bos taurus papillomavirus 20]|uniref:Major capsid protein L1 n=1 Tax=Bos taurus papillomavirus 20 TaxID=1887218 RepID=A0A1B2K274_9PAPI|nr:L1 capsid protein [Bos taurus papillomavirus 20]ANZ90262.1 L1 capsid protein [Bos taurus papillomavirus 20]